MANLIARFRMYTHDTTCDKVNIASLCYLILDGVPFWDYTSELMPLWLQAFHNTVGFAVKGIMPPEVGIMKYSMRLWAEGTPNPVSGGYAEWETPPDERFGVFAESGTSNQAQTPKINYTLRRSTRWEIEDFSEPPTRSKSIQFFAAPEAFNYNPPLLGAGYDVATTILGVLNEPIAIEAVPVIEIPELTAYPIHAKFVYVDELLSSDPDASNNDQLSGYHPLGIGNFSLVPRFPKKNRVSNYL